MNQSGFADLKNESIIESDSLVVGTLNLPNLDANSVAYIDSSNNLSDIVLTDGQLVIGKTGNAPIANTLTGTSDEVIITNGSGSITLSTPQPISTTSSPTFSNITITNNINGKVANDLVTGPASAINNDVCSFNSTTGKIIKDSGIATSNLFLKDGSVTATGNFNMGTHEITNISAIRPVDTNINIGNSTSLPLGGIGNIVLGDLTTATANDAVCIGLQNIARANSVAIGKETIAGTNATIVGYRSSSGTNTDSIVFGHDNTSNGTNADIFGVNCTNSISNSLLIGNGSYTNIRANTTCDLGTSSIPFQNIYSNSSLIGPTNSRTVDNIVSNTSTGTLNNLVSFVSDKVIKDSGIPSSMISGGPFLPLAGGTMNSGSTINANTGSITNLTNLNGTALTNYIITPSTSNLDMNSHSISNVTTLNSKNANDLVTGPASVTAGQLSVFSGTSGKVITNSSIVPSQIVTNSTGTSTPGDLCTMSGTFGTIIGDSGIIATNVVTNSGTATSGRIATFSSNKVIQDSGTLLTALVPYTGASTTLAMGTNPVTGSGANTAGSLSLSSTTDSTSTSTGTLICAGGVGIAKSAYVGTAVYVNTTSATAKLVVSGGVQNVASEDSCIRAISSALSAKIEIQNSTAVTGRVYELRVSSTGTFDITDRSAARTPFTIDNNASFGFNGGSFGSGTGVLFIANRSAAPSSNPAGGGILYCESGALKYRGSLGTVTTIANA